MLTVEFAKCSLEKATEKGRFIDDRAADYPTAMTEVAADGLQKLRIWDPQQARLCGSINALAVLHVTSSWSARWF
jgi:hypothetical protein